MGVMACDRKDCENIMCDTCVDGRLYVCNDCESEFKEYLISQNLSPATEGEIKDELEKFMATSKGKYEQGEIIDVDTFFNKYIRY